MKFELSNLKTLQKGKLGEYLAKVALTGYGLDVYTSEVDDKGIDYIVRINERKYLDIQVKTVHKSNYVFILKSANAWKQPFNPNLYLLLVILKENENPAFYCIPASAWNNPNSLLSSRDYINSKKKSRPDWGVNLSTKNEPLLNKYSLDKMISKLKK
jgi:hypothetical protein